MLPQTLLKTCTELLQRVLPLQYPADAVISRFLRELRLTGARERATLAETAYAALRYKPLLEHLARGGSGAQERRLAILAFQGSRDFLHAALTARERQWLADCTPYLPGGPEHDTLPAELRHNLPAWLAGALLPHMGEAEFWPLAASLNQSAPLDLRVNTLLQTRKGALQSLRAQGIRASATPYSPWGLRLQGKPALQKLEAFAQGHIEVQDEGSQLLALLLDAQPGEMVADFCAGAGGKTLALGAAMRSTGRLYAFDVSAKRLAALKPRLARSGLTNLQAIAIANERDERIKRLKQKMHRVLVDAPCSGMGTLRRNPDLKWRQTLADVEQLCHKQSAILASAAQLVRPGGRLVYATCSLLPQENEAIAQAFGAAHPHFAPVNAADVLHALGVPDAASLCTAAGNNQPAGQSTGQFLRLWPHRHATDGFFAAVWERV